MIHFINPLFTIYMTLTCIIMISGGSWSLSSTSVTESSQRTGVNFGLNSKMRVKWQKRFLAKHIITRFYIRDDYDLSLVDFFPPEIFSRYGCWRLPFSISNLVSYFEENKRNSDTSCIGISLILFKIWFPSTASSCT